jgi:ketosteroid isomerase-like protein
MAEHPNAELIRKCYSAFAEADMATATAPLADDLVWTVAGRSGS